MTATAFKDYIMRKLHPSITPERVMEAVKRSHTTLDDPGFCIYCGEDAYGVEPDAEKYECESCARHGVYGAEQILIMIA